MARKARKIIVSVATSADGYIALPDGGIDWLNQRTDSGNDYGMKTFLRSVDTILWGRATYDLALTMGGADFGAKFKNYVFSHLPRSPRLRVEFVSEPVPAFAKWLRTQPGKDIWMMGGSKIIASFLDAGEIDEFIVNIVPVFLGQGIPLIQPRDREIGLELLRSRRYPDGVVNLHYRVSR